MVEIIRISDLKDPNDEKGRTYKEVNLAKNHKYKVGELVELENNVRCFIAQQTRDCDGEPLYSLTLDEQDLEKEAPDFVKSYWRGGYGEDFISGCV